VGHADLFDAPDGSWWMVVLGSRPYGGGFCNLGRETFLVPVGWEDGWPVANPGVGRVEARVEVPGTPVAPPPVDTEAFDGLRLGPDWITLRVPDRPFGDLASTPGRLRLASRPARPGDQTYWSFAGKRQGHPSFLWSAVVNFAPDTPQGAAGLVLFQNDGFHIRFERAAEGGQPVVRVVVREAGAESVAASVPTVSGPLTLEVTARLQDLEFAWAAPGGRRSVVARGVDGRLLSTERAGGFVGTILALFATGGGQESRANADFSAWTYRGLI
jgi:alpha-N-arabinofuranosidase